MISEHNKFLVNYASLFTVGNFNDWRYFRIIKSNACHELYKILIAQWNTMALSKRV